MTRTAMISSLLLAVALLSACGREVQSDEATFPSGEELRQGGGPDGSIRELLPGGRPGDSGFQLFGFGNDDDRGGSGGGSGIGVNAFLWRASLDTISFMPLASADPFGGVLLTDWYSPGGTEQERFKVNVFILDQELRADAIRVATFRQVRDRSGGWLDAEIGPETAPALEEAILARARELRLQSQRAG